MPLPVGTMIFKGKSVKLCVPGCTWVLLISLLGRSNDSLKERGVENRYSSLYSSFSREKQALSK